MPADYCANIILISPFLFFFLSLNRALLNHSTYLASRHGKLAERERQLKERQLTFSIVCYVVKKKKRRKEAVEGNVLGSRLLYVNL